MRRIVFLTVLVLVSAGLSVCLASTDYNAGWSEPAVTKPAEPPAVVQPVADKAASGPTRPGATDNVAKAVTPEPKTLERDSQSSAAVLPPQQLVIQPRVAASREDSREERMDTAPAVSAPATPSGLKAMAASGFGTGFFVTPDIIATNWHIARGADNLSIIHLGVSTPATLVARDENNDLALLKISNPLISRKAGLLPIIDIRLVNVGEKVYSVGFPDPAKLGFRPKITDGLINSIGGEKDNPTCYQISTPVQPGNSGSPLINSHGQVVGIVSKGWAGNKYQNVSYAVKSNHLINLLLTLPEGVIIPDDPVFASPVEGSAIMLLARDAVVTVVQH